MHTIPPRIKTRKQLADYLLQYGLNAHGAKLSLDGDRGRKTDRALNTLWLSTMKMKSSSIPAYAEEAHKYVGLTEVPGSKSNPTILKWIKGFFSWAKDDGQLAWCAIFINTMMADTGFTGTGKANARSFLNWGKKREGKPEVGDVVVFWRENENSWKGHVGIYWGEAGNGSILCLGGNQRNKVSVAKYPKRKILEYRYAA